MKKTVLSILLSSVFLVSISAGLYYYQHDINKASYPVLTTPNLLPNSSLAPAHQLKPNAYVFLKNSINTLASSQQFGDFIKTDQLIQKYFNQLPLAQRYEVMDNFLRAVDQHISHVDGKKRALTGHNDFFLETTPEEYQPHLLAKRLLTVLPSEQKTWFSQAINYDFDILDIGEGFYVIRLNPNYLVKHFAPILPHADQAFIKAIAQQNQQQFYYDATIDISWQELGERAIFWENYNQQYPHAYFSKDAKVLANYYLYYFIHGMGNSMTVESFDEQENSPVFNDEAKQAFAGIKNKYPNSNVSQKIKLLENSMVIDQRIVDPVEPTERSMLMGQL
ncbi:MAG: hypothetical protein EOO69_02435 [Moraxellaceae bacterium]|nr:MAG: hypothetical protein EOO69_02435 [Moraxellaceae bacterium]